MLEYDYGIQNRSNINNEALDTIYRLQTEGGDEKEMDEEIATLKTKEVGPHVKCIVKISQTKEFYRKSTKELADQ